MGSQSAAHADEHGDRNTRTRQNKQTTAFLRSSPKKCSDASELQPCFWDCELISWMWLGSEAEAGQTDKKEQRYLDIHKPIPITSNKLCSLRGASVGKPV